MGIFLLGCFLFTFVTLMEYSITSYLHRKRTAFISKTNNNRNNSLLDIPSEVPINMQKTSNVSYPVVEMKGKLKILVNLI